MTSTGENFDLNRMQEAILQKEEDMKSLCPSSGENVGSMIEFPGTDEWYIVCPTCGTRWAGGSTMLNDHNKPGS
ncbi:hypothetical protein ACIQH9_21830 [Pseudarthrobacter oxydans]|uniref:hypothetical protein n=1 Tax=Pseudarthrobacter oxydans TaxID=1671 RepID=UPI00382F0D9C